MGFDLSLEKLSELKEGWNGANSRKPNAAALATARWLVAVPCSDGSIQLELNAGGMSVEIYIDKTGHVTGGAFTKSEQE